MTNAAAGPSADAIVKRTGLALPASATVELAEAISGQDDAARIVVVLPDADWAALKARLLAAAPDTPDFSAEANFHLGPDDGGYRPGGAKGLETAQFAWKGGAEALNVGIAPAGGGKTRLFVFWHQL